MRTVDACEAESRKFRTLILLRAICDQAGCCLIDAPDADDLDLSAQLKELGVSLDERLAVLIDSQ